MSEKVDQVAEALRKQSGMTFNHRPFWQHLARIAIEAMREPTEDMKSVEGVHWGYGCHVCGGLTEGWQSMIDAALKE